MKKLGSLVILLNIILFSAQSLAAESSAIAFARQAGGLAGTAKACGQDVGVFKSRAAEAIALLAANKEDNAEAVKMFERTLEEQDANQTVLKNVSCTEFLPDFAALPLLQDNYKEAVLAKLTAVPQKSLENSPPPNPKVVGDRVVNSQFESTVAPSVPSQSN